MRGVRLIDYTQLGLPYKLYSSYVQFNRGLCFMKLGNVDVGLEDLEDALRDKPKDAKEGALLISSSQVGFWVKLTLITLCGDLENEKIEQGMRLGPRAAERLSIIEMPQLVYKPPASKIENSAKVDYLGSSKVVAAIEASDNFTGFSGKRLKVCFLCLDKCCLKSFLQNLFNSSLHRLGCDAGSSSNHQRPTR